MTRLFLVLAISFSSLARGQEFTPSRSVELVVHSALGAGSDVFARALVEMIESEKLLAQPVRVVNKTAGASAEAMAYLAGRRRVLPEAGVQ
jgi:putative tricarboxylic transport membrane protein